MWRESLKGKVCNWEALYGIYMSCACMTSESEEGGEIFLREMKTEFLAFFSEM